MLSLMDVYGSMLQSYGHKITKQREAVLKVLLDNIDQHLKVEDIYEEIKKNGGSFGLATIYRAVTMLSEIGLVDKVILPDGISRYKLVGTVSVDGHKKNVTRKYRMICRNCDKVTNLEIEELNRYLNKVCKKIDMNVEDIEVNFYGICNDCSLGKENN